MAWVLLPTDHTDAVWSGLKRYSEIDNADGTISFQDLTVYTGKEKSFFGALEANRMNEALNTIMSMVENGTDLYEAFQNYFNEQKTLFEMTSDTTQSEFTAYVDGLKAQGDAIILTIKTDYEQEIEDFKTGQEALFEVWFSAIRDRLDGDTAGKLSNAIDAVDARVDGLQTELEQTAHFLGYVMTVADLNNLTAGPNDFAYVAETGTAWSYNGTAWADTSVHVPDQTTPLSNATPRPDAATALPGTSTEASRADHNHITDPKIATAQTTATAALTKINAGDLALGQDSVAISPSGNSIAIGKNAGASGNYAILIGAYAGNTDQPTIALKGEDCIAIGRRADAATDSIAIGAQIIAKEQYSCAIGYAANVYSAGSTGLGAYAYVSASESNTLRLGSIGQAGHTPMSSLKCKVALTVDSDERDKTGIEPICGALNFINNVDAVRYVTNSRVSYIHEPDKRTEKQKKDFDTYGMCEYDREAHKKGELKGTRKRVGVLAQQVAKLLQDMYGTDNYANIVDDSFYDIPEDERPTDVENKLMVCYESFIPFLIASIQELTKRVEALENA